MFARLSLKFDKGLRFDNMLARVAYMTILTQSICIFCLAQQYQMTTNPQATIEIFNGDLLSPPSSLSPHSLAFNEDVSQNNFNSDLQKQQSSSSSSTRRAGNFY